MCSDPFSIIGDRFIAIIYIIHTSKISVKPESQYNKLPIKGLGKSVNFVLMGICQKQNSVIATSWTFQYGRSY